MHHVYKFILIQLWLNHHITLQPSMYEIDNLQLIPNIFHIIVGLSFVVPSKTSQGKGDDSAHLFFLLQVYRSSSINPRRSWVFIYERMGWKTVTKHYYSINQIEITRFQSVAEPTYSCNVFFEQGFDQFLSLVFDFCLVINCEILLETEHNIWYAYDNRWIA